MPEPNIDPKIEILHEDDSCIAVSKSGNIPVHEGGLYKENCLTRILEKKFGFRLLPVYRLDRETSGIVIFAKKSSEVKRLHDAITLKEYTAVCEGNIAKKQKIDVKIGECAGEHIKWKKCVSKEGKEALTEINPVKNFKGFCVVHAIPKTGRQHQIRVHLSHIGNPIVGDKWYGKSDKMFKDYLEGKKDYSSLIDRQALHLGKIVLFGKEIIAELPRDMDELIRKILK
jgi:RluA family pseudouridine synthase